MSYESAIVRKALVRLERRRDHRERRRFQLERQLYGMEPRLRDIDLALRGTMADLALLAAGGKPVSPDGPEIAAIRAQNRALQTERTRILERLGFSPDALDDVPDCPRCGDMGWAEGRLCACLKELCAQEQLKTLTEAMNLTDEQDFSRITLDIYSDQPWDGLDRSPRENMRRVVAVCAGYARQFPGYPLQNLLLSGGTGLGKTFLSGCIAREVTLRGFSVVYDTANSIFDAFFKTRRFTLEAEEQRQAQLDTRRYLNCDLLILDDLGSEHTMPSTRANLYELVNHRLQSKRHTIISSNLSTRDIGEKYGAQLSSRVEGLYQELTFYGGDLRLHQ